MCVQQKSDAVFRKIGPLFGKIGPLFGKIELSPVEGFAKNLRLYLAQDARRRFTSVTATTHFNVPRRVLAAQLVELLLRPAPPVCLLASVLLTTSPLRVSCL